MSTSRPVDTALATLRQRWGMSAPRTGREAFGEVVGALATVPLPVEPESEPGRGRPVAPVPGPVLEPLAPAFPAGRPLAPPDRGALAPVVPTGFAEIDAILGTGGIPRTAGLALSGDLSSGRTTLALRLVAEAQAAGSIVAYVDLDRAFDPVEAVARGVRLEWLVVVAPASVEEGLAMAGALLQGRAVDLLLLDLPPRLGRSGRLVDALGRLTAFARRAGTLLVILEPPGRASDGWPGSGLGLRLELRRRAWIRLGRDVVGQRTEVEVARSRFGRPGGRAEVRILYADGGPRDRCLRRAPLLDEGPPGRIDRDLPRPAPHPSPQRTVIDRSDATSPPLLAPPSPPARADALGDRGGRIRVLPARAPRPRWAAVDGRDGARRRSAGTGARGPARDVTRGGAPAGT
jgi:recA bacterial DNA recombination protein